MEIVFVLIPISLIIIGGAVWAFLWSVKNDQFEDLDKEAHSIFFDDEYDRQTNNQNQNEGGDPVESHHRNSV
ncbi:MAG: cbb3-type cytochrome oxidase assembly protein CcoS [Gammaproteobacteria bacterium]|nr:cbb3-type cytochrome oxidase assembly protein CcoS [Gammaproteobacteria bacterium]